MKNKIGTKICLRVESKSAQNSSTTIRMMKHFIYLRREVERSSRNEIGKGRGLETFRRFVVNWLNWKARALLHIRWGREQLAPSPRTGHGSSRLTRTVDEIKTSPKHYFCFPANVSVVGTSVHTRPISWRIFGSPGSRPGSKFLLLEMFLRQLLFSRRKKVLLNSNSIKSSWIIFFNILSSNFESRVLRFLFWKFDNYNRRKLARINWWLVLRSPRRDIT